ncbi:MAG: universal stress protein [Spirochaetes bacterium]|jgi:nucleotide-binding universal stress UspA family protein|nr:universal stress protein [Spirochaetota bacterium]
MFDIKNILYPINLDSKDYSLVKDAVEIAKSMKSSIHILYVNDPGAGFNHPTDREDAIALMVREAVPADLLDSVNVRYAVSKGDLAKEVWEYCKKNGIDLIVTGHKHRNRLYTVLFDSPDQSIIDEVRIPALILPK